MLGNAIRIQDKNLSQSYWAQNKNSYQILDTHAHNTNTVLYCKVFKGKITGAVEVFECNVTRQEKILATYGNYKAIKKHFML